VSLLDDFLARRKMHRELEALAHDLAKQIKDSAADISPKHLHTGYEFGPVQQWLDVDIIAAARRGDRDAVLRIAEQSRQWIDKCRSDYAAFLAERNFRPCLRTHEPPQRRDHRAHERQLVELAPNYRPAL